MPSRVITASVTSGYSADKKGGSYITFGDILSDTGPVSNGRITGGTLYLSSYKSYSSSFYLDIIYGTSSDGIVVGNTINYTSNSSTHASTEDLDTWYDGLLSMEASTITLGVIATSGTGNKINIRDVCDLTLTIEYEETSTPCTPPTTVTVTPSTVDAGTTATLSWSGAEAGTNNPINCYVVFISSYATGGFSELTETGADVTSCTVTAPDTMGATYYYRVATVDTVDGSAEMSTATGSLTAKTYGSCKAPTTIQVSSDNVAPGANITLSWSGAEGGTNNPIASYQVYRAASLDGSYSYLTNISTTATSGSTTVTAPTVNGETYYYRIVANGDKSGYGSGYSDAYATLTCSFTAPTAPTTVTIAGGSTAYARPGTYVSLTWSGAEDGVNNPIGGFSIYQGSSLYVGELSPLTTSYPVISHDSVSGEYAYSVVALGAYSNSPASEARSVLTYGDPKAPTSLSVSDPNPDAGTTVTLSWEGASAGFYNGIVGFNVYRATTDEENYELYKEVTVMATSSSCEITAPTTMGESHYYKVETIGARSNSGMPVIYIGVTAKIYTACTPPTNVQLSSTTAEPGANAVLSWTAGSAGTNNPITGYSIFRKENSGSYALLQDLDASATNLIVSAPASMGSSYTYYIITRGTKSGYDSPASSTVTLSTYAYSACSAPTTVTLSATIAENDVTLSWSGASAGTGNPISGYRIRYQDSSDNVNWGTAQALKTVSTTATSGSTSVSPPATRGYYRRFLVQTIGTASGYDSGSKTGTPSLRKNRVPTAPAFRSGNTTYVSDPFVRLQLGTDPDGHALTLMLSVDNGTAFSGSTLTRLQNLGIGAHIIRAWSVDSLGASSAVTQHTLTVVDAGFTDPVLTVGETFVKAIHINELRSRINELRSYFGLAAYPWSNAPVAGETGLVSWRDHVLELRAALEDAYSDVGMAIPSWTDLPVNCPKAEAINELREAAQAI